ncbi:hypothetical protein ACJRO7_024033 [Eucalyptus globulus]|uniref:Ent-kaurene oxidase n=1 Tax=Eucalyptus globulus TaxID=34317 RepID=A0ABD3K3Y9_EUCGL
MSMLQDMQELPLPFATTAILGGMFGSIRKINGQSTLPPLPEVPGLPIVGNLLQLNEKKPHKTFAKWTETYGPIYSIRTGATTMVVLSFTDAMVIRFSSISTRKLPNALQILTADKCTVSMSGYDEFHKMVKRYILAGLLGTKAQKRLRSYRDTMMENVSRQFHALVDGHPLEAVNFRKVFESELFALALKQALGRDVKSIDVEELGTTLSKEEMFKVMVSDMMAGSIEVDWRDFFPYLRWVPNISWEKKIEQLAFRRKVVARALVMEQKRRIASGEEQDSYTDFLISEAKTLSEEQITILLWEVIIQASDYWSCIAINIYGCNMDKKKYEKPEEWMPERFLDEKYDPADLFKTSAFGGGKRVCAGALQPMLIFCTDGEEEKVNTVGLMTHKLHPMQAMLKPRRSE